MPKDENTIIDEKKVAIPFPGSLRDYFAGQALNGSMSNGNTLGINEFSKKEMAAECYKMADAMIKERDKNE